MELWEEDLYELLGVDPEASLDEVKKAYKKKAIELHPDRFPDDESRRQEATLLFGRITNAYNVLKDEEERAEYDFARRMGFGNGGNQGNGKSASAGGGSGGSKGGTATLTEDDPGVSEHKRSQAQNQFDQGRVYHKGKNWPKAIACYKEAARMDPTVADYHAYLGMAYLQQGLKTPANASFASAFKIDKKNAILSEHYEPAMSGKTKAQKAKDNAKPGLLAQIMALFGGGKKKSKKGKKGGKKAGKK